MKVEVVTRTARLSRSNPHWLQMREQFLSLEDGQCLKITELNAKEINTLRQRAYKEEGARCFTRKEAGKLVLYFYKRNSEVK